jgi:hypothetical protein
VGELTGWHDAGVLTYNSSLERDGQRLARVGAAEDPGADIVSLIDEFRLTRPSVALQRAATMLQPKPDTPGQSRKTMAQATLRPLGSSKRQFE